MDLKDKIVVITGGSKGLGRALAKALIDAQSTVVITDIDKEGLEKTAREIGTEEMILDVTDEKEVHKVAQQVVKTFGRIDIWINNAGIWLPYEDFELVDFNNVEKVFQVNTFGLMYGSKAAAIEMKKNDRGMIVNIVSVRALECKPGSSYYCASKFAADGFTKTIRLELADQGIEVIAVYPSRMSTNLFDTRKPVDFHSFMTADYVAEKIVKNISSSKPLVEQAIWD